jgi:hypothetical protein
VIHGRDWVASFRTMPRFKRWPRRAMSAPSEQKCQPDNREEAYQGRIGESCLCARNTVTCGPCIL